MGIEPDAGRSTNTHHQKETPLSNNIPQVGDVVALRPSADDLLREDAETTIDARVTAVHTTSGADVLVDLDIHGEERAGVLFVDIPPDDKIGAYAYAAAVHQSPAKGPKKVLAILKSDSPTIGS